MLPVLSFFFFKQKTAYEMRISDWSSDVCSSDLFLLSQWSAADMIPAPRVFAAGWIITGTGAHATERPVIPSHGPDYATEVDGPDAWRSMVSKAFKEGASVIKIASNFAPDEVRAGIAEAHLLGLKVSCDCETISPQGAVHRPETRTG